MTTQVTIKPRIVLPDTSLCAIVRDELMNPAKGIIDFVESTLPYVEAGVIVDTGSRDGTREALEELKLKYPHLAVYDISFQGFAHARNISLSHCKTRRALVLDADERLTRDDFELLQRMIEDQPAKGYNFRALGLYSDGARVEVDIANVLNPRLFEISDDLHFECEVGEELFQGDRVLHFSSEDSDIRIKHFFSSFASRKEKKKLFYDPFVAEIKKGLPSSELRSKIRTSVPPLRDFPFFKELRCYNPQRCNYR